MLHHRPSSTEYVVKPGNRGEGDTRVNGCVVQRAARDGVRGQGVIHIPYPHVGAGQTSQKKGSLSMMDDQGAQGREVHLENRRSGGTL